MARVTVEDCILKVPNRFDLVMLAAQRARDISAGASLSMARDNDKNPVVALREIAEESVELDHLRQAAIRGLQKQVEVDEPEEDALGYGAVGEGGAIPAFGDIDVPISATAISDEDEDDLDGEDGSAEEVAEEAEGSVEDEEDR